MPENCGGERLDRTYSETAVGPWHGPADAFLDRYWGTRAADWLREQGGDRRGPFALFVNVWASHPPLVLPEPYLSMFDPDGIDLPPNVDRPTDGEPPRPVRRPRRHDPLETVNLAHVPNRRDTRDSLHRALADHAHTHGDPAAALL